MKTYTIRDRHNAVDLRIGVEPEQHGTPERWVIFCNGRTEWIEKYSFLYGDLQLSPTTGFASWDHRGQGASGGARAWVDDFRHFAEDMSDVVQSVTNGQPFNLVAHSMGCVISLLAVMSGMVQPRCVVLSSPMLGLPRRPVKPKTAYPLAKFLTAIGLGHVNTGGGRHSRPAFQENLLTHSLERYQVIQNCPYPVPSPTFEWLKAAFEATQMIHDPSQLAKITTPILVLCGTEEQVVDIDCIQPWVQLAKEHAKADVSLQWIHGARHELLFESQPYYGQSLQIIRNWFSENHCPV